MTGRLERATLVVLASCALASALWVYGFSQERFFTVDEYQYGHATWLVSQGERPYVDFYEHHFPLSYVLHAPLLWGDASFTDKALRLRKIAAGYLLAMAGVVGLCGWRVTSSPHVGVLAGLLPVTFGFSLMTAVDYRADVFAGALLLAALALLERNRTLAHRGLAVVVGILCALAIGMTQKMLLQAGGTLGLLWLVDRMRRGAWPPYVAHPGWVALGAGGGLAALLAAGGAAGILRDLWEIGVVQALQHERFHLRDTSVFDYVGPFWQDTAPSTLLLAALVLFHLWLSRDRFWLVAALVAVAAVANVRAQYPYNYLYLCFVLGVVAARGYGEAVARAARAPRVGARAAWLYLLAPLVVWNQLAFVDLASDNDYQLRLLQKIEDYSDEGDAVIDNAGGAMFRPHGSYYYLHGEPHRLLFAEYFRSQLVRDYRESRALFWIWDFRFRWLPESVRGWIARHYVRADGDLHALGFLTPATGEQTHQRVITVIREGDYYVHRFGTRDEERLGLEGLRIEGRPVTGDRIHLEERRYAIRVEPDSPAFIISPLPRSFFEDTTLPGGRYTRIFEYDKPGRGGIAPR